MGYKLWSVSEDQTKQKVTTRISSLPLEAGRLVNCEYAIHHSVHYSYVLNIVMCTDINWF